MCFESYKMQCPISIDSTLLSDQRQDLVIPKASKMLALDMLHLLYNPFDLALFIHAEEVNAPLN